LWKFQTSDVGKIRRIDTDIIDSIFKKIKDTIQVVTESEVGKLKTARKPWFNEMCKEALNRRIEDIYSMI